MELQRSVQPLSSSLTPLHNDFHFFYLIATVETNRQNNTQIWDLCCSRKKLLHFAPAISSDFYKQPWTYSNQKLKVKPSGVWTIINKQGERIYQSPQKNTEFHIQSSSISSKQ